MQHGTVKFTGGDHLSGLDRLYHDIMMQNELNNGERAYQLSFAGGKSGMSFGGNQMDMHEKETAKELCYDILKHAIDEQGVPFFNKSELDLIVGKKGEKLTEQDSPKTIFGDNVHRINAALSSEYGKKAINAAYLIEIRTNAQHIDHILHEMKNIAAKKFGSLWIPGTCN